MSRKLILILAALAISATAFAGGWTRYQVDTCDGAGGAPTDGRLLTEPEWSCARHLPDAPPPKQHKRAGKKGGGKSHGCAWVQIGGTYVEHCW